MGINIVNGTSNGPSILSAEEAAVFELANLSAYVDFNDPNTYVLNNFGRMVQITNKKNSTSIFYPGLTPTGTTMTITDIGSDGQRGMVCASNRGVMYSSGNLFPASGSFTVMSIVQQTTGLDGYLISSGESSSGVSGGPFAYGWTSGNQMRVYTQHSTGLKIPTGFTNDGGITCSIICYDAATSELLTHRDGVLISTETSVTAPAYTDRTMVINGFRTAPTTYTGQVDGTVNLHILVNQFLDTGSAGLTALMDLANSRFPTEGWSSL